jgi:DNA (cytosine-5)-methyltransferase 1
VKFGSVCSGIEAASVAWYPLGWTAAWLSEIEPFPCAVLKHHYPDVPNHGDMTLLPEKILSGQVEAPDLFCGGTPCQAFSVAGLRNSLDDARGNLSLTFVGIANAIDHVRSIRGDAPAIVFWENVPGVLNTKDNAFGCFLGALAGESEPITAPGERWSNAGCVFGPQRTVAWRVLDAQYFGVAQRRRRVFVVASARDDINPAEILFEFEGVRRDTPQSRKEGKNSAASTESGFDASGLQRTVGALCADTHPGAYSGQDAYTGRLIPQIVGSIDCRIGAQRAQNAQAGHMLPVFYDMKQHHNPQPSDTVQLTTSNCATVRGDTPLVQPIAFEPGKMKRLGYGDAEPGLAPTLRAEAGDNQLAVAQPMVLMDQGGSVINIQTDGTVGTLRRETHGHEPAIVQAMAVRRLTPIECERLQGFPDNYSNIPWRRKDESPDGPRYKALGNSWAVPVVAWIGKRIQEVENIK